MEKTHIRPDTSKAHPGRIAWACLLAAGLLLIASSACPDELTWDVASLSLAASADLASTHYALRQCPTCREGNPLMREPAGALVLKAASVAGAAWACDRLRKGGHRGWARALRWTAVAVWGGVAVHNMRQANRLSGGAR